MRRKCCTFRSSTVNCFVCCSIWFCNIMFGVCGFASFLYHFGVHPTLTLGLRTFIAYKRNIQNTFLILCLNTRRILNRNENRNYFVIFGMHYFDKSWRWWCCESCQILHWCRQDEERKDLRIHFRGGQEWDHF